MADSIREQILQIVAAAIAAEVTPPVQVYRSRVAALRSSQLPAVIVSPVRDVPEEGNLHWQDRDLTIMVDVVTGEGLDTAADPWIQAVHEVMMDGERDLGLAAVTDVQPGPTEFMADRAGELTGVARMQWIVRYRTSHASLAVGPT